MTSKQRAYLKSLAQTMEPIFQIGKNSLTPENTKAIAEALEARELIKVSVLQNCMDDPKEIASLVAERTRSQVVQVIGKKIVLYKEGKEEKKKILVDEIMSMALVIFLVSWILLIRFTMRIWCWQSRPTASFHWMRSG